ncbi:sigma-70 family RNA polymerase sigma factor [Solibacillus sp. FSL R7-0668]|uniref:sigma-70 family RNA polymerase sigma factor n=1 Tax=Solibacillus sp. FSL R7-0668 TaxID=2921688 RepID=UPI0030F9630B
MDSPTFEQIVHTYGDYIVRLCFTYTKDWQLAEDLTQETFLRFYAADFRNDADIKTYLYRIAVNRCKTYLVSWRYRQTQLLQLSQRLVAKDHVIQQVEQKELSAFLYEKIAALPVKYREIIVLYHYFELTTAQIAAILKLSENTVKTRLRRGRQQLGTKIQKGELFDEFN